MPPQAGNDHPYSTPMGVIATSDGFINIGVGGDGQWRSLCNAFDRPDLAQHPDYATQTARFEHRPTLMQLLGDIFRTRTSAEWLKILETHQVPAGPIYKMDEVFADPQVEHLRIAVPTHHRTRGDIRIVGQPLALSRTPAGIATMTPNPGEHTDEVLREAGYSDSDIAELRKKNVV